MKSRIIFSQAVALLLILAIAVSQSQWETKSKMFTIILYMLGVGFIGIAAIGRLWCSLYIAGYKTNSLVTDGPYSMTRNPLYFFSLVGAVGVGLATKTLMFPVLIIVFFARYYPSTIKAEEERLLVVHSESFSEYFKNTPRFFPKLSLLKEPEEYQVKPIIFRKHIFDALWFIWIIGLLKVVEILQEMGVLPVYLCLY